MKTIEKIERGFYGYVESLYRIGPDNEEKDIKLSLLKEVASSISNELRLSIEDEKSFLCGCGFLGL